LHMFSLPSSPAKPSNGEISDSPSGAPQCRQTSVASAFTEAHFGQINAAIHIPSHKKPYSQIFLKWFAE
jgi:hypothetical protein